MHQEGDAEADAEVGGGGDGQVEERGAEEEEGEEGVRRDRETGHSGNPLFVLSSPLEEEEGGKRCGRRREGGSRIGDKRRGKGP